MKRRTHWPELLDSAQAWLLRRWRLHVARLRPRTPRPEERSRFVYQQRFIDFAIPPGARVLDIGSGGDPFPLATVLVDRFPGRTHHRYRPLVRGGRMFVEADVCRLPFPDRAFDFVYCAHVLEHVADPIGACREIMRVGRRGYIETPALARDVLCAWGVPDMHKWHVVQIAHRLCFFELSPRQSAGIGSPVWRELLYGRWHHPMQDVYWANVDLFHVMFLWQDRFAVHVFRLDGSVSVHDPPARSIPETARPGAAPQECARQAMKV